MSSGGPPGLVVNASPTTTGRTRRLADLAAKLAAEVAGGARVVDLARLDAEALLGRRSDPSVAELLADLPRAEPLVLVTPIYRATYSGLLKVVFDLLASDALAGVRCVLAATAGGPAHYLALDTGLRPLVAGLGGWSVPTVAYATPADLPDGAPPSPDLVAALRRGLLEAASVSPVP